MQPTVFIGLDGATFTILDPIATGLGVDDDGPQPRQPRYL
jgi:hypothetical protein